MANKYCYIMKSKKGTTLVEVIAAVAILAIVVLAVLTSIGFSQTTILSGSSEADAAAQAQNIADTLISSLHGKTNADPDAITNAMTATGAVYVASTTFPNPAKGKQFTFTEVSDSAGTADSTVAVKGYKIKVAVYYTDKTGRKCVQMTAFAAEDGD